MQNLFIPYAATGILICVLLAWQLTGNPAKTRQWLGYSALSGEILAGVLSITWAINQGGMLAWAFAVGITGMAIAKATTAAATIHSYRTGNRAGMLTGIVTMAAVYGVVYLTGVFSGTHNDATRQANAAAQSAPVQAIDAQLAAARERLNALSGYADGAQAANDSAAVQAAQSEKQARLNALQAEIDRATATAAAWANPDCTPRLDKKGNPYTSRAAAACAEIQTAQTAYNKAAAGGTAGGQYAAKHAEYLGLRQAVADMESRRAEMLSNGGIAEQQATGADNRLLAWITGLPVDRATHLKWLLLVLAFDLISLILRILSELQGDDPTAMLRRKINALLTAGIDLPTTAAMLTGGNIPIAKVQLNDVPAMEIGGKVLADGLAVLHRGERVLTAAQTAAYEAQGAANSDAAIGAANPLGAANLGAAMQSTGTSEKTPPSAATVIFQGIERVSPELSQRAGKNRVGKLDACKDCGKDYQVKTYNGVRCPKCAHEAEKRYVLSQL